jgi:hypothetical protein
MPSSVFFKKVSGLLDGVEQFRASIDPETAAFRDFVRHWHHTFQLKEVTVAQLRSLARGLDLGEGNERRQNIRLGKLISDRQGQVINGCVIEKCGVSSGIQQWRLRLRGGSTRLM